MGDKIKVLIVDDSLLIRKVIADIINKQSDMEVVGEASDGTKLLEKLKEVTADVITLDVEMGKMNGIEVLKELEKNEEVHRILMVSSLTTKSSEVTMECLRRGALDFIEKPDKSDFRLKKIEEDLVEKIRVISKVDIRNIKKIREIDVKKIEATRGIRVKNAGKIQAIAIGASTGGPKALNEIITKLPEDLGVPIFIVQHMPKGFTKSFAERLDRHSSLRVSEGFEGQVIGRNVVYIAPGGYHMEISSSKKITLNEEPTIWGVRPAVDNLFVSAAKAYESGLLSIVLTGMGKDGAAGTIFVKSKKGYCISQDEESSLIYGMPRVAYETGSVDKVVTLEKMAETIVKIVKG
ncbi:MAG: protein-glutamate methylesterase/protein-glutamine glutaminase [Sarcina sp.]